MSSSTVKLALHERPKILHPRVERILNLRQVVGSPVIKVRDLYQPKEGFIGRPLSILS